MIDGSPENLRKLANPRCKKCHGLGRLGFVRRAVLKNGRPDETAIALACKCVKPKAVEPEALKAETPKVLPESAF